LKTNQNDVNVRKSIPIEGEISMGLHKM